MTRRAICWLLAAAGCWAVAARLAAQEPGAAPTYTREAVFRIPFQTDTPGRLKQVQLYISTDRGQTWRQEAAVLPTERFFDFRAPQDGLYWFSVRTVDLEGRTYPPSMEGARAGLQVVVDTQPPTVRLRALPPRDGEVGAEWEVRDDNLFPGSLRLEYRHGGGAWVPLASDLVAAGQRWWRPDTNGALEVRLSAEDRAGNRGEDKLTLTPGDASGARPAESPGTPGAAGRSAASGVRMVNSKRVALNYEIRDKGPSGVSSVELWFTRDPGGRKWERYSEEKCKEEDGKVLPYVVDVHDEGLYGFTLVVKSGVGLGDRPPQVGDQPQVWVEVDLTKPVVRLTSVDVGRGSDTGRLTIRWVARDKNLGPQPIILSYAEQAGGTWKPIAANVDNSGSYVWQMPKDVPYQFLVRVEAADRAGNVGADESPKPVIVDLFHPKGVITAVEPAAR
jgi:hypothetical protein